jgi:hypothetical protein
MSPNPNTAGSARSSAVVNEEIRALVEAAGGWLYGESRRRYADLVAEWAVAIAVERRRSELTEAA